MLCIVVQPNSQSIEVSVPPKARGQECLNQVCNKLDIIEVDYFGLQYEKNGDRYWLNLRNPIRPQIGTTADSIKLYLRVKFYVPPHFIQQNSTRHQFYLNIRESLYTKRLRVENFDKRAKLIALISQAELGDYKCDSYDLEMHYLRWIRVFDGDQARQSGRASRKRRKHNSGDTVVVVEVASSAALQPSPPTTPPPPPVDSNNNGDAKLDTIDQLFTGNVDLCHSIIKWHRQFQGYLQSKAEYDFLKDASKIEDVGVDYFVAQLEDDHRPKCQIGVGTYGVVIRSEQAKETISYSSLEKVRTSTSFFTLKYHNDENGTLVERKFRLASTKTANALYRVVTEKHVFYSCDTVNDSVATQCIPNFTGMFWSIAPAIFKEDPEVGKNFVFDIRRTLKQFYEDVQRNMYRVKTRINTRINDCGTESTAVVSSDESINQHSEMACQICFDSQVAIVFLPCGDAKCCERCGANCDKCPFCRKEIDRSMKIYL